MSNERPDEFLSWRNRLDVPDALPGLSLAGKEAVWQQLQSRLEKKPTRRRIGWWPLAVAASVLLLILPPRPSSHPATVDPATIVPATSFTARAIPARPDPVYSTPVIPEASRPEHPPAIAAKPSAGHAFPAMAERQRRRSITLPAISPADTLAVTRPSPAGQFSMTALASNIPELRPATVPRRILRVVAANETGSPLRPPVSMTANQRFFRIDLFGAASPGSSVPGEQGTDRLLKIKLTDPN